MSLEQSGVMLAHGQIMDSLFSYTCRHLTIYFNTIAKMSKTRQFISSYKVQMNGLIYKSTQLFDVVACKNATSSRANVINSTVFPWIKNNCFSPNKSWVIHVRICINSSTS